MCHTPNKWYGLLDRIVYYIIQIEEKETTIVTLKG